MAELVAATSYVAGLDGKGKEIVLTATKQEEVVYVKLLFNSKNELIEACVTDYYDI